jgi:carbon-monoxide dehydrogenase small subunit
VLGVQADGAEIETAASLARDDELDPIQSAFRDAHATQCGYCTPGLLATSDDLLSAESEPSRERIREALEGNLCRCTGYQNVIDAVETAAEAYPRGDGGDTGAVAQPADDVDVSESDAAGGDRDAR